MGSHMNFKNFGDAPHGEGRPPGGNYPLARQPSVYSLTFEEFQNTWGGIGKDFGSMNMDELLKNIWTAEENQAMTSSVSVNGEGNVPGGNLQRQGSITLPRTLSQKTVDEVWRDVIKESSGGAPKEVSGGGGGGGGSNMPQRQPTLGEITLEEFLLRAGVVREDANQINGSQNNGVFYANNNSTSLALGFQQPSRNNGLMGNRLMQNNNLVAVQPPALALNVNGLTSLQQSPQQHHLYQPQQQQQQTQHRPYQPQQQQQQQTQHCPYQPQQQQQQQTQHQQYQPQQQQQQPLFPKQTTVAFAPPMNLVNTKQLNSPGARGAVVTVANPSMNNNLIQAGGMQNGGMGMVGLGTGSPASQVSPDMIARSSADTSSSPVPYVFGRGRKSGAVEKVVERRHRRMIKNRESAARSRARKQAYTLELEAEVAKLKELNQELQKKQAETVEMQKDQVKEQMRQQWGGKRQCLRRTLTGPW